VVCTGALVVTIGLLWSPFLLDNGPGDYLRTVANLQVGSFASLSIGAWNLWWLVGQMLPPNIVSDATPLLGPVNGREIGIGLAVLAEITVFLAVWHVPSTRRLALGLACATLASFSLLTTMHERYSLAALIFLVPLLPDRRVLVAWVALSLAITGNMLVVGSTWVVERVSVLGSALILGMTLACFWYLTHDGAEVILISASQVRHPTSAGWPRIPR
jgi:hypothetical protein